MRDIHNNTTIGGGIKPVSLVATDLNGTATPFDLADLQAAEVVFSAGVHAGTGTALPVILESDDGTTWGTVAQADLLGTPVAITATTDDVTEQKIGYVGNKRYISPAWDATGTPTIPVAASCIGHRRRHIGTTT